MADTVPTPTGEFQAHFGGPPGSADAVAECKKWEALCAELPAEREKLRAELTETKEVRDAYIKAWIKSQCTDDILEMTNEEILACVGQEPPLRELIEELASDPEN
jgi:hypothetical protein